MATTKKRTKTQAPAAEGEFVETQNEEESE
jgi:hypothetical protein